jgi:hypothetical protein
MRHLLIAGVLVLASTVDSSAQTQLQNTAAAPINLTFIEAQLGDALSLIATYGGVTIEFDATVTEEMRRAPLAEQAIRLNGITVEEAIATLTSMNGLTYTIIGPKAVRISKKP